MRNLALRLVPLAALALAACTSPAERCRQLALAELETLDALIAETEVNLARGYAIRRENEPYIWTEWCVGEGGTGRFCQRTGWRTRRVAEPIDPAAERRKLAALRARRAGEAARAAALLGRCPRDGKPRQPVCSNVPTC